MQTRLTNHRQCRRRASKSLRQGRLADPLFLRSRRLLIEPLEDRRLLSGAPSFSQMVVFGDSLSDTGNDASYGWGLIGPILLALNAKTTDGRFTSGTGSTPPSAANGVWAEELATCLYSSGSLPSPAVVCSLQGGGLNVNYAYGGAETGTGTNFVIADNVGTQVSHYFASHPTCDSQALYVLWAGGNDLFDAANNASGAVGPHDFDSTASIAIANLDNYAVQLIAQCAIHSLA